MGGAALVDGAKALDGIMDMDGWVFGWPAIMSANADSVTAKPERAARVSTFCNRFVRASNRQR